MTREDCIDLLHYCKGKWPEHYADKSREDHFAIIEEWSELFADLPRKRVMTALYTLSKMPTHPSYNEIVSRVDELSLKGTIDWKRLKQSYITCGFDWPDRLEAKLQEAEKLKGA